MTALLMKRQNLPASDFVVHRHRLFWGAVLSLAVTPVSFAQVVTHYSYDAGDHISQVTDPRGLVTSYTFDGLGQKWQQVSPDTGTTGFSYDGYGRLASMTRADGGQTTYGYDGISRRTSESAGGLTHSFTYDNCTNGIGRLCLVSDATGNVSYVYSPEGWITGRGFSVGGTGYSLGYGYNALGQVTTVAYPDGNQALYSYSYGVVSGVQVKVGSATSNAATAVTYFPGSALMTQWTSGNGLVNTISYDTDGRLKGISASGVQSLGISYDSADRVTGIVDGIDTDMTQSFGFDEMSRLISVQSNADNESFQYDASGNRTAQNNNGTAVSFVITPGANQVTNRTAGTIANYGYDVRGNLTTVSGAPYFSYDAFNRMTGANGATYYVNPEGQRLQKVVGGSATFFAPDQSGPLLAENQTASGWVDYVYLNGRLIARANQGQLLAIHNDQVGRPEVMTDSGKNVVWRARNTAFDRTIVVTNAVPLNLTFPGQYYDDESNLSNNGFRDYSPLLGRYVESDPLGLGAGVNTYAYVNGNPLSFSDLLGLYPQLSYQTVSGGSTAQSWKIQWQLSEPSQSGGWIVQTVTGALPSGQTITYSEAWQVAPGASSVVDVGMPFDDVFMGFPFLSATAAFYEGADLPSSFVTGKVPYAGDLPSALGGPGMTQCPGANNVQRYYQGKILGGH